MVNVSIDVKIGPKTLSHHPHLHRHSISAGNIGICQKFQLYLPQPQTMDDIFQVLTRHGAPGPRRKLDTLAVVDDLIRRGPSQKLAH